MSRKRTAEELRKEGLQKLEQAKLLELQERAAIGLQLMQIAEKFGKTPVECLAILQEQLLTSSPQAEASNGKDKAASGQDLSKGELL